MRAPKHRSHHGDDNASSMDLSFLEIENDCDNDEESQSDIEEELSLVHGGSSSIRRGRNERFGEDYFVDLRHRPYWPLYLGAAVVGAVLVAFLWIPSQDVLLDSHSSAQDYSCHNATLQDITKFLDSIDLRPQKERCIVQPGRKGCPCENPIRGSQPNELEWNMSWQITFQTNLKLAQEARQRKLDLVLLGDSITESWHGTSLTKPKDKFEENAKVYHQLFESEKSQVQGLALGIAGDRCTQLLYRLQHGEIEGLNPKVFWVLIGTNDFLRESCHTDEIVAGNIRISQEILSQRPSTTVVIQSVLPVGDSKGIQNWDVYSAVNQRLECYARSTPQVEFVNMTQLFLTAENTVNESLLPDGIHPAGGVAAAMWGTEIVKTVLELVSNRTS